MKKIVYFIALFGLMVSNQLIAKTLPPQSKPLSLAQAVSLAHQEKPSLFSATEDIAVKRAEEKQAYSSYLPNITASAELSHDTNAGDSNEGLPASVLTIDARSTFFDMTKAGAQKAAHFYVKAAHAQRNDTSNKIRYETETAFLSAWLLQKKVELIDLQKEIAELHFVQAATKKELALIDSTAFEAAILTKEKELALVTEYTNEYNNAKAVLEKTIGISITTPLEWNPHHALVIPSLERCLTNAKLFRQDLQKNKYDTAASTQRYNQTCWELCPKGTAFATLAHASETDLGENYTRGTTLNAGLKLNWALFDGTNYIFERDRRDALRLKSILDTNSLALDIKAEVETAYNDFCISKKELTPKNEAFKKAQLDFKAKELQYQTGLLSSLEFKTAFYTFKTIEFEWITAIVGVALKETLLNYRCGYPR